jgi:hypothetical protein
MSFINWPLEPSIQLLGQRSGCQRDRQQDVLWLDAGLSAQCLASQA